MIRLFLSILFIPSLTFSQINLDKKFHVYGCLKLKEHTYIKQTEVSIKEWYSYVNFKMTNDISYSSNGKSMWEEFLSLFPKDFEKNNKEIFKVFLRSVNLYNGLDIYNRNLGDFFLNHKLGDFDFMEVDVKKKWIRTCISPFPLYLEKENFKDSLNEIEFKMDFPIAGLTNIQVEEYLLWQEDMLNSLLSDDDNFLHKVKLIPIEIYDTLISDILEDFEMKDENNMNYVIGDSVNQKGCQMYNFKGGEYCPNAEERIQLFGNIDTPARIHDYHPGSIGVYNILGNVAEMTSSKGIAVGGHYEMYADEILENEKLYFNKPSDKIGFRYMVSLVQKQW